jgi:hypothetical protein
MRNPLPGLFPKAAAALKKSDELRKDWNPCSKKSLPSAQASLLCRGKNLSPSLKKAADERPICCRLFDREAGLALLGQFKLVIDHETSNMAFSTISDLAVKNQL